MVNAGCSKLFRRLKHLSRVGGATVILTTLVGCAGTSIPMTAEAWREVADAHHIDVRLSDSSGFRAFTPLGADDLGLALLFSGGGAARIRAREKAAQLIADYDLKDPGERVREQLAAALQRDLGAANVRVAQGPSQSGDQAAMMSLEIETLNWSLTYFLTTPSKYRIVYFARASVLRASDNKAIWKSECVVQQDDAANAPTLEQLEANSGELLKEGLRVAADACAEQLISALAKPAP